MCVHPWHGWTFMSSIRSDSVACMSISYCSTGNWVPQRPAHPFQRWHVINYFLNILSSAFSSLQITQVLSWKNEDSDTLVQSPWVPSSLQRTVPSSFLHYKAQWVLITRWGLLWAYLTRGIAQCLHSVRRPSCRWRHVCGRGCCCGWSQEGNLRLGISVAWKWTSAVPEVVAVRHQAEIPQVCRCCRNPCERVQLKGVWVQVASRGFDHPEDFWKQSV